MFEWDRNNLRKIRAHRISRGEVEEALLNDPILVYEQDVEGESRFVYYGATNRGRLLALIVTERGKHIRVVTAYDLDAGQRRDYHTRRAEQRVKRKWQKKQPEIPKFKNESEGG